MTPLKEKLIVSSIWIYAISIWIIYGKLIFDAITQSDFKPIFMGLLLIPIFLVITMIFSILVILMVEVVENK